MDKNQEAHLSEEERIQKVKEQNAAMDATLNTFYKISLVLSILITIILIAGKMV